LGVVSPILLPDMALLDADLTLGLPPAVHRRPPVLIAMVARIEGLHSKIKKNPLSDIASPAKPCACFAANLDEAVHQTQQPRSPPGHAARRPARRRQAFANAIGSRRTRTGPIVSGHFHISPWPAPTPLVRPR